MKEKDKEKKLPTNPFLKMRARKDDGHDYKTVGLVAKEVIPLNVSPQTFQKTLMTKFDKIPGNRPIETIGSPSDSPLQRPKSVYTPGGTKLSVEKKYGCLCIYSNAKVKEIIRDKPENLDKKIAEVLEVGHLPMKKMHEIIITKELLEKAAKEHHLKKRGTKGVPDQNACMAKKGVNKKEASATKIASLANLRQDLELWEWLHLIAFFIQLVAAQKKENLTGGTKFANTDMIFTEDEVIYLAEVEEEFLLRVTADEFDGLPFAEAITYTFITKHFTVSFVFDAQTSVNPSLRNKDYIHGLMESLVEVTHELLDECPAENSVEGTQEVLGCPAKRKLNFDSTQPTSTPMPKMFFSTTKNTLYKEEEVESKKPKLT